MSVSEQATPRGMSTPQTYEILSELAAGIPADQAIVELGTYEGRGAIALADGAQQGGGAHVWGIDPWDLPGERTTTGEGVVHGTPIDYTDPSILTRTRGAIRASGHKDHITLVQGFSEDVGREWRGAKVGLWYHDADHREPAVRRDYTVWEPHLANGGVVVFDDYHEWFPGVIRIVGMLVDRGLLAEPLVVDNVAICNRL